MRFLRPLFTLLVLAVFALPALAQPKDSPLITLDGGYTLTIPAGWARGEWGDDGVLFESGDSAIVMLDPATMDGYVRASARDDIAEALIAAYDSYFGDRLAEADLEIFEFAGYPAAQWFFEDDAGNEGVFITADLGDGAFVAFDIVAPAGERDDAIEAADKLLASLTTGGVTSGTSSTTSGSAGSGEPCVVSVESANSAALRVGPGTNRSSVAFLPAGEEFAVIGSATANDGSAWFKLDKAEAAPRSAANEIWVARADVDETGDCDAVADAAPPPVVPILNNPPPATPAPGGSSESGTTTTTNTGTRPQQGIWTIVFARQSNVSCEGFANQTINTSDAWTDWDESDYSYSGDLFFSGANIVFAGDTFRPTGSPNQYVTNYQLTGSFNNQLYITFTSPTTFSAALTGNGIFDGVACSGTTGGSGQRN